MQFIRRVFISILFLAMVGCGESVTDQPGSSAEMNESRAGPSAGNLTGEQPILSESERLEKSLAEIEEQMGVKLFVEPWTGDLDRMAKQLSLIHI